MRGACSALIMMEMAIMPMMPKTVHKATTVTTMMPPLNPALMNNATAKTITATMKKMKALAVVN